MRSVSGIYAIENQIDFKIYIGSTQSFKARWSAHKTELRAQTHHNKHLQYAWNKYGEIAFLFKELEECPIADLLVREQFHLDHALSTSGVICYNHGKIAALPEWTEERREEARIRLKGNTYTLGRVRPLSERLGTSLGNTGKVRTDEHKENYRRAALLREAKRREIAQSIPVVAPWLVGGSK